MGRTLPFQQIVSVPADLAERKLRRLYPGRKPALDELARDLSLEERDIIEVREVDPTGLAVRTSRPFRRGTPIGVARIPGVCHEG